MTKYIQMFETKNSEDGNIKKHRKSNSFFLVYIYIYIYMYIYINKSSIIHILYFRIFYIICIVWFFIYTRHVQCYCTMYSSDDTWRITPGWWLHGVPRAVHSAACFMLWNVFLLIGVRVRQHIRVNVHVHEQPSNSVHQINTIHNEMITYT